MRINKKCSLVLTDLYYYDITKCYFTILKNMGWNISDLEVKDKLKRNIQIGILQKEFPSLKTHLNNETDNLINFYLKKNNVLEEDIITIQKDGMILKKKISIVDLTIPIDLRFEILRMIFTLNRKSYLLIKKDKTIDVKGVRDKPIDISFYDLFLNLDFSNKKNLINGLEIIRIKIMTSTKIEWFSKLDENNMYNIPIKGQGIIRLNYSSLDIIDINDVDKEKLWKEYVWPFCQSIILNYH